jgi:hypothetical protein
VSWLVPAFFVSFPPKKAAEDLAAWVYFITLLALIAKWVTGWIPFVFCADGEWITGTAVGGLSQFDDMLPGAIDGDVEAA